MTGYMKMLSDNTFKTYLSPAELKSLKRKQRLPNHDSCKSDIYSLGMLMLYAATLKDPIFCYDFRNYRMDEGNIQANLAKVAKQYSEKLANFLQILLKENPKVRPEAVDLVSPMKPQQSTVGTDYPKPKPGEISPNQPHSPEQLEPSQPPPRKKKPFLVESPVKLLHKSMPYVPYVPKVYVAKLPPSEYNKGSETISWITQIDKPQPVRTFQASYEPHFQLQPKSSLNPD